MPHWDNRNRRVADRTIEELAEFLAEHGHWPSKIATDPAERTMVNWLWTRRAERRKGTLNPEVRAELDRLLPEWFESYAEAWDRTAREVAEFTGQGREAPGPVR